MRPGLEEQKYELIKAHVLDPDNSPLPEYLQVVFERTIQAAKILEKNPVQKNAVAILRSMYTDLSRAQAYEDCNRAQRIFNSIHTFDYNWWQHWLIQDIAEMIQAAKTKNDMKAWAMGHANLLKAIGEKPETELDAKLIEKHNYTINLQINNQMVNIDLSTFLKLPAEARAVINSAIHQEIDDDDAKRIMLS